MRLGPRAAATSTTERLRRMEKSAMLKIAIILGSTRPGLPGGREPGALCTPRSGVEAEAEAVEGDFGHTMVYSTTGARRVESPRQTSGTRSTGRR